MIEIALALALVAVVYVLTHAFQEQLDVERARVNELLGLLEAKAAPAEYAARTYAQEPDETGEWIFSADGLVGTRVDD